VRKKEEEPRGTQGASLCRARGRTKQSTSRKAGGGGGECATEYAGVVRARAAGGVRRGVGVRHVKYSASL